MSDLSRVDTADDPRIAEYVALNDPEHRRRVERQGGYFIVEGLVALERLLTTPEWEIRSVLLLPKVAERLDEALGDVDAPILVADEEVLYEVAGFPIHRGALASVTRIVPRVLDAAAVPHMVDRSVTEISSGRPLIMMVEGLNDHENLGAIYRNAAGLGARAVVLDDRCADPFYRRAIRVSSGLVLTLPTYRTASIPEAADLLRSGGVTIAGLTPSGDTDLRRLDDLLGPDDPVAVVVGAEGPGLTDESLRSADHRVAIHMADDVDSLNVATAAAIALHHLRVT